MCTGAREPIEHFSTVVGIKDEFDVARGRTLLRTMILARHMKSKFNLRAAAALTALCEFILAANSSKIVPMRMHIVESSHAIGVKLSCAIESCQDTALVTEAYHQLRRTTEDLDIQHTDAVCA
jgi:hypothetical protein